MAKSKNTKQAKARATAPVGAFGSADTAERTAERMAHLRSGAAGIHSDQYARNRHAAGRTNRVGSRSTARRAAVRDWS
jgi:hypothetical protein